MNAAVEIGAVTTREGAALHPVNGCRWSRLLLVTEGPLVELTKANASRCCKTIACRKAIRAALEAARTANSERAGSSHRIVIDKINVDARLTVLVGLFSTKAEQVRKAELKSRMARPVAVAEDELARRLAIVEQYRAAEAEEPELVPLSAFGAIKARYAQTHRPVTGRVAHVRLAA